MLVDVKEGVLPGQVDNHLTDAQKKSFLEEERRLFYVAVTRAGKSVKILKYYTEYDGKRTGDSRFIRELMMHEEKAVGILRKIQKGITSVKAKKPETQDISLFVVGADVVHRTFGNGRLTSISDDKCSVSFENGEERVFSLSQSVVSGFLQIKK